jgi:hypothetical protein
MPSALGLARLVERGGRITGYSTGIGQFAHAVAETRDDLIARPRGACYRPRVCCLLDAYAGIQDAQRVQRLFDTAVEGHGVGTEVAGQPRPLQPPDTVFAGDRAAEA